MAETVTVHVEGLRELGEAMRLLSNKVALKYSAQATNAAAQVIKKRAKQTVKSQSYDLGDLWKALIVKKIPKSQTNLTSEHIVTIRGRGKKRRKSKVPQVIAPHAGLIEFGTVNAAAEPFLRPAFDSGKEEALQAMVAKLKAALESK